MRFKGPGAGGIIFGAALLLRGAWILFRWHGHGAALEFPDEELHWELARNLVTQGTLVSDDGRYAARMPVYPLFLALFAWWSGTGVLLARLAQAVLGAAAAWVGYSLAGRVFGRRAGLVAGVLICIDPYAVFFSNLLLTEVLFTLLAVGLTACAWSLVARSARTLSAPAVGVAVLGAAAIMTRPSAAGWIPLLWLVLWLLGRRQRGWARRLGLFVGVLAVCLLPWALRNRSVLGAPAWLSTNGGVTLYDALGPQADGSSDQSFLKRMPELKGLDEVERDQRLYRLALDEVQQDPARVLRLAWTKFARTWNPVPNVRAYRGGATGMVSAVFTVCVLLAAFAGLLRAARSRKHGNGAAAAWRAHALLWLPVIYFALVHCVFVGSLRYRVPLMPFLEIAAAAALARPSRAHSQFGIRRREQGNGAQR